MTTEQTIVIVAVLFEIAVRLLPTKLNFSLIDAVKNTALKIHSLIDIMVPNAKKD
jgi:hypothetical protein